MFKHFFKLKKQHKMDQNQWRHMKGLNPNFSLSQPIENGDRHIIWQEKIVGATKSINRLKQYAEGPVFIVASGPSLNEIDLSLLKKFPLFGVAGSIVKFREFGLTPTHHLVTDINFFEQRFELVEEILATAEHIHLPFHGLNMICERNPDILAGKSIFLHELVNNFFQKPVQTQDVLEAILREDADFVLPENGFDERVGFSKNPAKGVFSGRTVVFQALQLSYYLGFQPACILGMDMQVGQTQVRFYEDHKNAVISKLDKDFEPIILPSFQQLKKVMLSEPFNVYNLSLNSRLADDVMPKKSLDDILTLFNNN